MATPVENGAAVPAVAERRPPLRIAPVLTAIVLTGLLLWVGWRTVEVWLLLFVSSLLALYLGAVADVLHRRARLPRPLAFWIGVVVSLGMAVGLVALLVPPVVQQTQQLAGILPSSVRSLQGSIQELAVRFPSLSKVWAPVQQNLLASLSDQLSSLVHGLLPHVVSVLEAVATVLSVVVMALYLAIEPLVYREWAVALFPPAHRDLVRDVATDLAAKLREYIVAQLTTMLILGALTALGLRLIGVPYWLTFGVLSAAAAIVPVYGVMVSTTIPAIFVLGQPNGGVRALVVLGLGVLCHVVEGNIISPNIMAKRIDLPPVLTMMAVLIFGALLGPVGLLVAVPLLVTVMVLIHRLLVTRVYEGRGFRRPGRTRPMVVRVPAAGIVDYPADGGPDLVALSEATAAAG